MIIQNRPEIQHNWEKQYKEERKNRLADSVCEYLEDEYGDVDFFMDLRQVIQDQIDYHNKEKSKFQNLMKIVSGHRSIS